MQFIPYLFLGLTIWVLVLSIFLFWIFDFFRKLTTKTGGGSLIEILKRVLIKEEENAQSLRSLKKDIGNIVEEDRRHIQKVGLERFNPFKEMGGGHSFSLSLLDGKNRGVILTGLHARERTRVYIKKVESGKSDLELSKEEKRALEIALKNG